MSDTSDVAVIGVGRMGRHHARTYASMPRVRLAAVVDADLERAETVADEFGCAAYCSTLELIEKHPTLLGASIAVPTRFHADVAEPLLARRTACLVEKPLAHSVGEARRLASMAKQSGAVLQVGHTERFNPAVRAVSELGITPRFMDVDRVSPMSFRSLDVGVVMDVMIHDLDIVMHLARSPIERVDAAGVAVLGRHEDIASARIVFRNGTVANIAASRISLKTERKLRIFNESVYVSLDYQTRRGKMISKSKQNLDALDQVRARLAEGADLTGLDYENMLVVEELSMDLPPGEQDPLFAQLSSFIHSARTGADPAVGGDAGFAAVDAAERVVAAIQDHKWEGLANTDLRVPAR